MSRVRLKEYQNSYAEQMAKYGLQQGIDGPEAKHVATSQYYRDLLTQSESVQENVGKLLEQKEQAEQELSVVKLEISKEKFKNSAADVGTTLLDGVGSLFGSSKTKQQQRQIEALTAENRNLSNDIKELNTKIRTMETEHKTAIDKLTEQLNKIYTLFPHIKELLRWESFLKSIGLPNDMARRLFNKEAVIGSGELYSKEHSKRFKAENATLKLEQDKTKPENIRFTINGTDIFDWFKQKQKEFLCSIRVNIKEPKNNRGMKL